MEITYSCPSCGGSNRLQEAPLPDQLPCRHCHEPLPIAHPGPGSTKPLTVCRICGDDKFYIQKKFNQKIGCLIVLAGALLVPWTYGLSLALCVLIDFMAYRRLPLITVCYVCGARYSGLPLNPDHQAYELMTAQTWEARSVNWRKRYDRSIAN